ncbi:MAG: hypothetical protein IPP49_15445 [Saprospiraceae bacterium]|nr:hypothetical protein [Saprospiraceae bacterium]
MAAKLIVPKCIGIVKLHNWHWQQSVLVSDICLEITWPTIFTDCPSQATTPIRHHYTPILVLFAHFSTGAIDGIFLKASTLGPQNHHYKFLQESIPSIVHIQLQIFVGLIKSEYKIICQLIVGVFTV